MYFSTQGIPESRRVEAWANAVNDACGSSIAALSSRPEFQGCVEMRQANKIGMMRMAHTAQSVRGDPRYRGQADSDQILVLLQIAGRAKLQHADRTIGLEPGDLTVMDRAHPFSAEYSGKNTQLVMFISHRDFEGFDIDEAQRVHGRVPTHFAPTIGSFLQSAFELVRDCDEVTEDALQRSLALLLKAAWNSGEKDRALFSFERSCRGGRLFSSIHQYIASRLADEDLSPTQIAAEFNISERQLHRILASEGQSVGRIIRRTRLDRCAADLRNPTHSARSITDIAFGWGFNDAAHFSRLFRAEFDQSPTEYRTAAVRCH